MALADRLKGAWQLFLPTPRASASLPQNTIIRETTSYQRRDRHQSIPVNAKTLMASVYNRIANDCASIRWEHVRVDENEHYLDDMPGPLERCLRYSPNPNQNAREFRLDCIETLLEEGAIAIVPIDTTSNPIDGSFNINALEVGKITQWGINSIEVDLYNPTTGERQRVWVPKAIIAVVENPFYSVMNNGNSTLQRLISKMSMLDAADADAASKSLDLIIQLPYSARSEIRKQQASERVTSIGNQLKESDYGIAYIDATERVTQLNRPLQNGLQPQIEYLTKQLFAQLGISENVFNGMASEQELLFYQNKVIEPILDTITSEMTRKFLTSTGITQGQRITYYMDRFKLASIESIASTADIMSRNEIMSPNEFRSILGYKASDDPMANSLANRNMSPETATASLQPSLSDTFNTSMRDVDSG